MIFYCAHIVFVTTILLFNMLNFQIQHVPWDICHIAITGTVFCSDITGLLCYLLDSCFTIYGFYNLAKSLLTAYSIILIVDMRLVFSQEASRLDDDDNHSFTAGSQERYDSNLTATTPVHTQKYVDPFNPNSVIKPLSANQRRWVHTFPIGQYLPVTKSLQEIIMQYRWN